VTRKRRRSRRGGEDRGRTGNRGKDRSTRRRGNRRKWCKEGGERYMQWEEEKERRRRVKRMGEKGNKIGGGR
jgi:hypothetical protein